VHTTFFDLLWQLKRELELKGNEAIDMPAFIEDRAYRLSVLNKADFNTLGSVFHPILPALLEEGKLDITRQVPISSPVEQPRVKAPVHPISVSSSEQGRKRSRMMTGVFILMFLLSGLVALATLFEGRMISDLIGNTVFMAERTTPSEAMPPVKVPGVSVAGAAGESTVPVETLFRLHGSNTIGEALAPALLKAFWQQQGAEALRIVQGGVEVEQDVLFSMPGEIAVQRVQLKAHGSSTGFEGLLNGDADLAMSSRRIKDEERSRLAPLYGDLGTVRTEHVVGMDGLAIIVHPHNPINSLNTAQLARLFAGEIGNWAQLGGPDLPVRIYSRDENSGTWDSFKNMVLKRHGVRLAPGAQRFESSMELSEHVSQDPGAIGFIGLPYVLRAKALAVADEAGALPVFPTTFTVSTEDYPLTRRLYIYEPMTLALNSPAHRFIRFVTSEEGQEIVRSSGFISQNIQRVQPVLSDELPSEYLELVRGGERLSLNFRFNSGTFELDNKAQRDLERVIRFFENNPGQRTFLIGFSDSIGDAEYNRKLSLRRAEVVRDQLLTRGINVAAVHGLGALAPVASNATAVGRERNRRVEVWVQGGSREKIQSGR